MPREMDEYGDTYTYGAYDYYQRAFPSDRAYGATYGQGEGRQNTQSLRNRTTPQPATAQSRGRAPATTSQSKNTGYVSRLRNYASDTLRKYTRKGINLGARTTSQGEYYTNPYAGRAGGYQNSRIVDEVMGGSQVRK